jgi:hypothetical protein
MGNSTLKSVSKSFCLLPPPHPPPPRTSIDKNLGEVYNGNQISIGWGNFIKIGQSFFFPYAYAFWAIFGQF